MNRYARTGLCALSILSATAGESCLHAEGQKAGGKPVAGQARYSPQEQAVLDLEQQLLQARVTTKTARHEASFAGEGMYIHSSGRTQNKAEVLEMVAKAPWASWTKAEQQINVYGDLAVTHSLLTVLLADKRTETVRTTGVYAKKSGLWQQVSWQSSIGKFVNP